MSVPLAHQASTRRRGFTLLELLVAMAVLSMLVVTLFGMVDAATKLWQDNENRVDAYREARAALNTITDDLKGMFSASNQLYISTNFVGSTPGNAQGDRLFFLSSLAASAQPNGTGRSDICAVGYFRRFTKQNLGLSGVSAQDPTKEGYHLYRALAGSGATFTNLSQNLSPFTDLATGVGPEILARNVCDLQFVYFQTNAAGKLEKWNPAASKPFPDMIEVRLSSISDETAKRLGGDRDSWNTNNNLVARSIRTFVSRVQIPRPTD